MLLGRIETGHPYFRPFASIRNNSPPLGDRWQGGRGQVGWLAVWAGWLAGGMAGWWHGGMWSRRPVVKAIGFDYYYYYYYYY